MEEITKQSRKANYNNSKIFILEPKTNHTEGDVFYSSTTQSLFKRLSQYKKTHLKKNTSYKMLFEKYGIDNIKIVLVKSFSCNNKEELEAEEAKYIRENDCINKQEIKEQIKEDKQEIKEIKEEDKQEIKENKEIKEENKTKKSRDKEYYNKNKENILKKRREQRQEKNKQQEEEILLLKGKTP
jgi:hypothetical protein